MNFVFYFLNFCFVNFSLIFYFVLCRQNLFNHFYRNHWNLKAFFIIIFDKNHHQIYLLIQTEIACVLFSLKFFIGILKQIFYHLFLLLQNLKQHFNLNYYFLVDLVPKNFFSQNFPSIYQQILWVGVFENFSTFYYCFAFLDEQTLQYSFLVQLRCHQIE